MGYVPTSGVANLPKEVQDVWHSVYAGAYVSYVEWLDDQHDPVLTKEQNRARYAFGRAWAAVRALGYEVPNSKTGDVEGGTA